MTWSRKSFLRALAGLLVAPFDLFASVPDKVKPIAGNAVAFLQGTPPTALGVGDLWFDISTPANMLFHWNGTHWDKVPSIAHKPSLVGPDEWHLLPDLSSQSWDDLPA